MSGTNKQPRVLSWLRALLRNPWAPVVKQAEQERLRAANASMPRR